MVVDGVLISNEYIGIGSNPVSSDLPVDYGNSLNDLNPDDFESVTVLKGPKAAALYGERGTNGVLVITTINDNVYSVDLINVENSIYPL